MPSIASSPPTLPNLSWNPHKCIDSLSPFLHSIRKHSFWTTINRMALLFKCVYIKIKWEGMLREMRMCPASHPQLIVHEASFTWVADLHDCWKRLICYSLSWTSCSYPLALTQYSRPSLLCWILSVSSQAFSMVLSHIGSSGDGGDIITFPEIFSQGLFLTISPQSPGSEPQFGTGNKIWFPWRKTAPTFSLHITRAAWLSVGL